MPFIVVSSRHTPVLSTEVTSLLVHRAYFSSMYSSSLYILRSCSKARKVVRLLVIKHAKKHAKLGRGHV